MGPVDVPTPLPEERTDGGGATALRRRITGRVASSAGMVGCGLPSQRPRPLRGLGTQTSVERGSIWWGITRASAVWANRGVSQPGESGDGI